MSLYTNSTITDFWIWFAEREELIYNHLLAVAHTPKEEPKPRTPAVFHECDYRLKHIHQSFRMYFLPSDDIKEGSYTIHLKCSSDFSVYHLCKETVENIPPLRYFVYATPMGYPSADLLDALKPFNVSFDTNEKLTGA